MTTVDGLIYSRLFKRKTRTLHCTVFYDDLQTADIGFLLPCSSKDRGRWTRSALREQKKLP